MTIKVSFSGPHGLGKTTKAKLLHSHLRQKGNKDYKFHTLTNSSFK